MENNKKYNGWKNYATWRVALEVFDGSGQQWYDDFGKDVYDMSQGMMEYAESVIELEGDGLALDYALAFLGQVDFYEIAQHVVDEYHHFGCEHCGGAVEDIDDDFCSDRCKQTAINEAIGERI